MTEFDVAKFIRLRSAICGLVEANPAEKSSAFEGLVASYARLRAEVAELLDADAMSEFDQLFPKSIDTGGTPRSMGPAAMLKSQEVASTARGLLGQLAGWLDGFIESAQFEARLEAEARALAEARIRAERGVGFTGPSGASSG